MTAYQKLTLYLKDGRTITSRHPTAEMALRIEEAKQRPDFLEFRVDLA